MWGSSLRGLPFDITAFVYAQMASLFLTLAVLILLLIRKMDLSFISIIPSFDTNILKKSLPFALVILVMSAYSRIDGVMLERMLDDGAKEAGIYAASYRILDALNIIGVLFASLLLPMFSKLIDNKKEARSIMLLAIQLLCAIAISVALFASYFGDQLMISLYPDHASTYYSKILTLLTWGFVGIAATHVFGTLLTANHSLTKMNILFTLGLIINILLNWYFIPEYKAIAAAGTTLVTEIFVALGLIFLVRREFKYGIGAKPILRLIVYALILFAFYYSASSLLQLEWSISLILGIIVSFVVSILLQIIDIRELKEILINR